MFEEDDTFPVNQTTTTYIWHTTNIDGTLYTSSVGIQISSSYTDMGENEVRYCDKADNPGTANNNKFLTFYWGH